MWVLILPRPISNSALLTSFVSSRQLPVPFVVQVVLPSERQSPSPRATTASVPPTPNGCDHEQAIVYAELVDDGASTQVTPTPTALLLLHERTGSPPDLVHRPAACISSLAPLYNLSRSTSVFRPTLASRRSERSHRRTLRLPIYLTRLLFFNPPSVRKHVAVLRSAPAPRPHLLKAEEQEPSRHQRGSSW